jgi:hypothetical protein
MRQKIIRVIIGSDTKTVTFFAEFVKRNEMNLHKISQMHDFQSNQNSQYNMENPIKVIISHW